MASSPTNQNLLPPPPIQQAITDNTGMMATIWINWFNLLFKRAGGGFSPSQSDLNVLLAFSDIFANQATANTARILTLEAQVAILQQQQRDTDVFLAFQKDVDLT